MVIRIPGDLAEELEDFLLSFATDVLLQGLVDRLSFGGMTPDPEGLLQQPVIDGKIGRHLHNELHINGHNVNCFLPRERAVRDSKNSFCLDRPVANFGRNRGKRCRPVIISKTAIAEMQIQTYANQEGA